MNDDKLSEQIILPEDKEINFKENLSLQNKKIKQAESFQQKLQNAL